MRCHFSRLADLPANLYNVTQNVEAFIYLLTDLIVSDQQQTWAQNIAALTQIECDSVPK